MNPKSPGFVIWLTGLPASGKSSLALAMQELLRAENIHTVILDANHLRLLLTPEPEYTDFERQWLYRVITGLATMLAHNSVNVLIAATGNRRLYREEVRRQNPKFAEVYLHCPLETCQERDTKGQYARGDEDGADSVPGIGVAYEAPFAPEVIVHTAIHSPVSAAKAVISFLRLEKIIGEPSYAEPQTTTHPQPAPVV